jgi:hypothetical protein
MGLTLSSRLPMLALLRQLLICFALIVGAGSGTSAGLFAADTDENAGIIKAVDNDTTNVGNEDYSSNQAFKNTAAMTDATGGVVNMLIKIFNGPVMILLCLLGGTIGIWGFFQSKQISSLYYGFGGVFAVVAFRLVLGFLS